jgi:outer membrane lipoprotein SlyB
MSVKINGKIIAFCATALLLSGCAREISPNVYSEAHVGEASQTFQGTILTVRQVQVQGHEKLEGNQLGMAAGALAGGVAGYQFGKGKGNVAATAGGAILGATAGAFAQKALETQDALEYTVQLSNGEMRTVVQGLQPAYGAGQRVLLIVGRSGRSRIVPFNG